MNTATIKELDVFGLLSECDIGKSMGLDKMHLRLLKKLAKSAATQGQFENDCIKDYVKS